MLTLTSTRGQIPVPPEDEDEEANSTKTLRVPSPFAADRDSTAAAGASAEAVATAEGGEEEAAGAAPAAETIGCAVLTISEGCTPETDEHGRAVAHALVRAGFSVGRRWIERPNLAAVRGQIRDWLREDDVHVVITVGGAQASRRQQPIDIVAKIIDFPVEGFGELFRWLYFAEKGSAAIMSRAVAGFVADKVLIGLPAAKNAIELAMDRLIVPELPHLVRRARTG